MNVISLISRSNTNETNALMHKILNIVFFFWIRVRNAEYRELLEQNDAIDDYDQKTIQMQRQRRIRQENTLEAQIQSGDTLQAIALRYNCTVSVK